MSKFNFKYSWLRDLPDFRDHVFNAMSSTVVNLPPKVDLTPMMPKVLDQGAIGSCVSNSVSSAYEFDLMKQKYKWLFSPSRLFIYYNARVLEGTVDYDSGLMIRDAIKVINTNGVCTEKLWPYIIEKFTVKPNGNCYKNGLIHKSLAYKSVPQDLNQMKSALVEGFPIVFGMAVYSSFETKAVATTGKVPLPKAGDQMLGGHCMLIIGYDDETQCFIVRNSWSEKWGNQGNCEIPYSYLTSRNLAGDLWVISSVS